VNGRKRKKGWKTGRLHWPGSHHQGHDGDDHHDVAQRLTPLEETEAFKDSPQSEAQPGGADDTIRVDSKSVHMPEHLVDDEREGASIFRLEPVAVVILLAMLAFIAFIAWQITLMPLK
jgi:hypothetical protein